MRAMTQIWAALLAGTLAANAGDTGTDPAHKCAWGENAGWVNAAPTRGGVSVCFNGTSGYLRGSAWGENVGWIKVGHDAGGPYANTSATDWGVNMDASGALSGYGWGENVGWIKFAHAYGGVKIDPANGEFAGNAWGENVGWVRFRGSTPDYGVRTLAFDTQPLGTPNWWLDHHAITESDDEGDGVPAWKEYVADTDPNDSASYLSILAIYDGTAVKHVVFWPGSTRRYYSLSRCSDLEAATWSDVTGQVGVPGTGGMQTLHDTDTGPSPRFYRVGASVTP